jgi:UDP:flavonoid glycosyltransferase YjiC (YdhE family)
VRFAIVCSAHGYGHVTRQRVVADVLVAAGDQVTFFSAAPAAILGERGGVSFVPWTVDVGLVQPDSLTEDVVATRARLDAIVTDAAIDALAARLEGHDRVVVDIAPPALEAARRAGVPALAIGNFDWAWIYSHYPSLQGWARRFGAWQVAHHACAIAPGPGLFGFASVRRFGLVGRRAAAYRYPERNNIVLVCFGGFGLDLEAWLPRIPGVIWVLAPPMRSIVRDDVRYVADVPFPALVAGADLLLTKPGYGIFGEAARAGVPIVWLDRGEFPEAPSIEAALTARGDRKATRADLAEVVRARLADPRPMPVEDDLAALVGVVRGGSAPFL